MKILHTSDWHLGRSLYGRKRYDEFTNFLDWMTNTIVEQEVDALLIAGDVFDTSTPSNRAQKLYYRFLCRVATTCCRNVVVIAGNHDSPSFLNAPKELLRAINVYVVGSKTENLEEEVIVLKNEQKPEAIICAVPYLRDKDIRTAEPGESIDDKNVKLVQGLKKHYQQVCDLAEQKQIKFKQEWSQDIPIVGMGHLFAAGGKTVDGDGVRELYVGTLAYVDKDAFPDSLNYVALGHLHVPQKVSGSEHIRYSGSPIPMGYGEANQQKKIVIVEFVGKQPNIKELDVPCFQQLVRIVGSLDEIKSKIEELKKQESTAWLEIEYTGNEIVGDLRDLIDEAIENSELEIRRIKNRRIIDKVISRVTEDETLDDLNEMDVFARCLEIYNVPEEDRQELTISYNEILRCFHEEDNLAE